MPEITTSICFGEQIPQESPDQFTSVSVPSPEAPELECRLVVPNAWNRVRGASVQARFEELAPLAAFDASEETGIQIWVTLVPWEVDLLDWLSAQADVNGFTLTDTLSGESEYGQVLHAEARTAAGAYMRMLVAGNGPNVFWLAGRMPEGAGEDTRQALGLAAATFELTQPPLATTREPLETYTDPGGMFHVLYPQSWQAGAAGRLPNKAAADLRLISDGDLLAFLRVEADGRFPLDSGGAQQVLNTMLQELDQAGVVVKSLGAVEGTGRLRGEVELSGLPGPIEIFLRPAECWLAAAILYPPPERNTWAWMRARRALRIAETTLAAVTEPRP